MARLGGNAAAAKGPLYISPMKTIPLLLPLTFIAAFNLGMAAAPPAEDPFIWL